VFLNRPRLSSQSERAQESDILQRIADTATDVGQGAGAKHADLGIFIISITAGPGGRDGIESSAPAQPAWRFEFLRHRVVQHYRRCRCRKTIYKDAAFNAFLS